MLIVRYSRAVLVFAFNQAVDQELATFEIHLITYLCYQQVLIILHGLMLRHPIYAYIYTEQLSYVNEHGSASVKDRGGRWRRHRS